MICEYVLRLVDGPDAVAQVEDLARRPCDCGNHYRRRTGVEVIDGHLHLVIEHGEDDTRLPVDPLVDAVRLRATARGVALVDVLNDSDRRLFYRWVRRGWVGLYDADRIAVQVCGLTVDELYGFDQEAS